MIVKIYGWVPDLHGRAGEGRNVSDVDVSYCGSLNKIGHLECLVPVNLEARYGAFGLYADLFHYRVDDHETHHGVRERIVAMQSILELGGYYRAGDWTLSKKGGSALMLDLIAGARYNRLDSNIGIEHTRIILTEAQEWLDPFVGPRVTWHVTKKLGVFARGDVGGFGIPDCSRFAWQIVAGAEYDFTRNFFIELGFRLLDFNYQHGSGSDRFVYDVLWQGPYLAIGVKF